MPRLAALAVTVSACAQGQPAPHAGHGGWSVETSVVVAALENALPA